jgi:signal peptidase I
MPPRTKRKTSGKKNSHLREWAIAFSVALVSLLLVQFFVIDFASFSDSSMEKSLLPGDVLIVKKYSYGSRMPQRVLPQNWANQLYKNDSVIPVTQLPYWRTPGFANPDYNHLVLINIPAPHEVPIDKRTRSVKRMVALPGDRMEIKGGVVFINGKEIATPGEIQWNYLIETRNSNKIDQFLQKYQIREGNRLSGHNRFVFSMSPQLADSVARLAEVRRIQRFQPEWDPELEIPFGVKAKKWTPDNFGPITLPYNGYSLPLNEENLDFYSYHLVYHEGVRLTRRNDSIFVNDQYVSEYTFRHDYYFFLGDNRHNTIDSRLWGMLPENHIIGEVSSVFISFDKDAGLLNKIRWRRLFHPVRTG